ncbi:MAG: NAD(P)H-dependent oxidoreductase subunit E [Deferribacteres bacterium]|nr:NAD(P)H-dependent oxidoreductase subunit E [candidate division KSB1 bacterium]MCB9501027.1 NAD(P)H-dependent oxidoreductase subunit E [Deferribacteres bacterium]
MSDNLSYLSGRKGLDDSLFEKLTQSGHVAGTPENSEMKKLAEEYLMGDAIVYGTASFYDFLKQENARKLAYACNGSACLLAGTQDKVQAKLHAHFGKDEIGEMCCLGRCHENSAFHIDGKNYSGSAIDKLETLAKNTTLTHDQYAVTCCAKRPILTAQFSSISEFYASLGAILRKPSEEILQELKVSNLRGRGGAGFPLAFKLLSCREVTSEQKFIVCNADEGDPGAFSDRYILEEQPHNLLMGMIIAGYTVGADTGVIYIRAEYPEAIDKVKKAVVELHKHEFIGNNIMGSGFNFKFKIIAAAGAYICGEETALLSSLEGQRPEVRVRPPYPTQQGLFNKPTVVNNVETLAAIPWILKNSGQAYAQLGTTKSSGTKLVCLDSAFGKPGLYEVEMGMPLRKLIDDAGGFIKPVKALHIGGPLGGIVPISKIDGLTIDFESFAENGFLLGHASIISIPEDFPMVKYLEHLFAFTAHESCGKCFPCRLGSQRGKELLQNAQTEDYKIDRRLFDDLLETLESGSLCALGGGLPLGVKNALKYFDNELKAFFE